MYSSSEATSSNLSMGSCGIAAHVAEDGKFQAASCHVGGAPGVVADLLDDEAAHSAREVERRKQDVAEEGEHVLGAPVVPVVLVDEAAVGHEDVGQPRPSPVGGAVLEALLSKERTLYCRIILSNRDRRPEEPGGDALLDGDVERVEVGSLIVLLGYELAV